jgi:hypothetical protein
MSTITLRATRSVWAVGAVLGLAAVAVGQVATQPGGASTSQKPFGTLTDHAEVVANAEPHPDHVHGMRPSEIEVTKETIAKAIEYLRSQQDKETGAWGYKKEGPNFPAITALVLQAMMAAPGADLNDPAIQAGIKHLLNSQKPDGGIYDSMLPSYNTAIAILPLSRLNDPRAKEAVKKAAEFLKSLQYGEGAVKREGMTEAAEPVGKDHPYYGGWGYGSHGRPDLSNTAWALEGLKAAGVEPNDPAVQRAVLFLQRCQMQEKGDDGKVINELEFAKGSNQGGFIYAQSMNKDTVGVGQSMAGEMLESLDGGPGCAVFVRFRDKATNEPILFSREEFERRIRDTAASSDNPNVVQAAKDFIFNIGPTRDGKKASVFWFYTNLSGNLTSSLIMSALDSEKGKFQCNIDYADNWRGVSKLRAYGSMTYSGFKSYLYANLAKDDPRVTAALRWISQSYALNQNPGMNFEGLYYYYVVFGRALQAWGKPTIDVLDEQGNIVKKRWAAELCWRIVNVQQQDGSFLVFDKRWMEDDKVLITAYGVIAMEAALGAK